jgi:hypothetical protein
MWPLVPLLVLLPLPLKQQQKKEEGMVTKRVVKGRRGLRVMRHLPLLRALRHSQRTW